MKQKFTHLHVHSHYSLLNALPKIPDLIARAKKNKMDSIAITDDGNLYGAIEFYQKCVEENIKPIIGVDFYVALRTRKDKEARIDSKRNRLILLAKNTVGYKNLIKLVTISNLEGFYYKPRIDKEIIEEYKNGLICIMPAFGGEISEALRCDDFKKAKTLANFYTKNYGANNFYLELTYHPEIEGFTELTEKIKKFARQNNISLVATNDIYYMNPDDREARKTVLSVQSNFSGEGSVFSKDKADFSFTNKKKIFELFKNDADAIKNTQTIANDCNLKIETGKWKFPDYKIESGLSADKELKNVAYEGISKRGLEKTKKLTDRIDYELKIIKDKGYSAYFLVVADILQTAKEKGIFSNTRGSAAGSFVSYLSGITTVNPITFNLPFERFLNPERPSAPDIDVDFADDRRDELIEYVREKYGRDHVAQIGTFGTMAARGVVRDITRAMGYEYSLGDQIAKLIPVGKQGFPMTISRALSEICELADLYKENEDVTKIIDMAQKIEGGARHIGVHAAGVVISPDLLTEDVPIQFDPKGEGKLITQYDMYSVGEDGIGLLKFDFLGLKNLKIMADTVNLIDKIYDEKVDIDKLPLDDDKTFKMLTRGETSATFQLNGQGITRYLKELKPTNVNDINAMVALYRPGPMAFIPDYIERKHHPEKVKYLDDRFKEILEPTFGILIYQDDIMMLAVKFAGYSWGEADKFRKAMGKKVPEIMEQQKEKFSKGCIKVGGLSEIQVKKLWESIETFAAYGFNKAHAASYGRIAYLTSYLKAHYPILYMTAVLIAESGDIDKVAEMVKECKRMKIDILPPDINESFEQFTALMDKDTNGKVKKKSGKIRFGLSTIKNFGEGIAKIIIKERKENGEFKSLEDFLSRVNDRNLNKRSLDALAKSGAFDSFSNRADILGNLEEIISYSKEISKEPKNQNSLFSGSSISMPKLKLQKRENVDEGQKLAWEREFLGLYISSHPLNQFKDKISKGVPISKLGKEIRAGMTIIIAGHIDVVKIIRTKKNEEMAFVRLSDLTNSTEVVVFPSVFEKHKEDIVESNCIAVKGKVSDRNGEISVLADNLKKL